MTSSTPLRPRPAAASVAPSVPTLASKARQSLEVRPEIPKDSFFERIAEKSVSGVRNLIDRHIERPYVIARDGFLAVGPEGQIAGGRFPGAIVRDRDIPALGLDRGAELIADAEPRDVAFKFPNGSVYRQRTDAKGSELVPPRELARAPLGAVAGARGGLLELDISTPNGEGSRGRTLVLPQNYDGPVFVCDIDDTLRDTPMFDVVRGEVDRPLPGAKELLAEIARRGIPIVYLSAGTERLRETNEAFLKQLPPGILLDRQATGLGDLVSATRSQADLQAEYKAGVLGELRQAIPDVKLFGLGDDKFGDALAYGAQNVTSYVRDVKPDDKNLPADFDGVVTRDYSIAFRERVLGDLDAALARSASFGGERTVRPTTSEAVNAELDRLTTSRRTEGNQVEALIDGPKAFPAMLDAIRSAKTSIYWETYEWKGSDDTTGKLTDELIKAHRRGVAVRVVADAVGARELFGRDDSQLERLRAAGVEVSVYNPVDGLSDLDYDRNHRKSLVVDRSVAFLGGMNTGDEYFGAPGTHGWRHDVAVRMQGPAAAEVARVFLETRAAAGRASIPSAEQSQPPAAPSPVGISARVIGMDPRKNDDAEQAWLAVVNNAQRTINIENPYPLSDRLVTALSAAVARGVEVRYVLPQDTTVITALARKNIDHLLKAGVRVFDYPDRGHAKAISSDGEILMLGSSNADAGSFEHNLEVMSVYDDAGFVQRFDRDFFEKDMRRTVEGRRVTELKLGRKVELWDRLKSVALDLIIPDSLE